MCLPVTLTHWLWTAGAQEDSSSPQLLCWCCLVWFGVEAGGREGGGGCHCMVVTSSTNTDCNIAVLQNRKIQRTHHLPRLLTIFLSHYVLVLYFWFKKIEDWVFSVRRTYYYWLLLVYTQLVRRLYNKIKSLNQGQSKLSRWIIPKPIASHLSHILQKWGFRSL